MTKKLVPRGQPKLFLLLLKKKDNIKYVNRRRRRIQPICFKERHRRQVTKRKIYGHFYLKGT